MSKIRFFALGGLGENGKNMYVVEVDKQYFILDAGLKYPSAELHGIDEIIPDYRILTRIKNHIKGIFLSHAHEDHIGALTHVLRDLNVPVYGSHFTIEIVKDLLKDNGFDLNEYSLNEISQDSIIKYGNVRVSFFNTSHSIPGSLGIAIHTMDGLIVYTSDFTFEQTEDSNYQTNFRKLNELADRGVLALLSESLGAYKSRNGNEFLTLGHKLNGIFTNSMHRIIVSVFSSDLKKIQLVIDVALANKKKIAIVGRRAQRIVDIALENGYIKVPKDKLINLKYINEKNRNDDDDLVVLVTGSRHEPFQILQRMCTKADRLVHIDEYDTIIVMTSAVPGTEKMNAKTLDILSRSNADIQVINNSLLATSHATAEELKIMLNLLNPKYIIPVIGEYQHQYGLMKLAAGIGYSPDSVFLLDNGDVLNFDTPPYVGKSDITVGEILIDGTAVGDVNDYVIRDRELLAEDGVLMIVANVSAKEKKILGEIQIMSKGFIYLKESAEILDKVKEIFIEVSEKHLNGKYVNWNEYKRDAKNEINRFIYQEIKRSPITIPVIISTEL